MMNNLITKFFNDGNVRTIWVDDRNKFLYSVVDIIGILTDSKDPRNYWKVMKSRVDKEVEWFKSIEQHRLLSSDNKMYLSDCIEQKYILPLVNAIPSNNKNAFIEWFSKDTGKFEERSRNRAYSLFNSELLNELEPGKFSSLKKIHSYLFDGQYEHAGQIRNKNISKDGFRFAQVAHIEYSISEVEKMGQENFDEIIDKYTEMNIVHPFMDGNGRSTRIWLDLILKASLQKCVNWSEVDKTQYLEAMKKSHVNNSNLKDLLSGALTSKINDREVFMKGIDQSYYYEEEITIHK